MFRWNRTGQDRIVQLEGIFKYHQVQLPDQLRANQKLEDIIEGIIKCLLKSDRHGVSATSLGSLFQCLTTFKVKKKMKNVLSSLNLPSAGLCHYLTFHNCLPMEPPVLQFVTIASCPCTEHHWKD